MKRSVMNTSKIGRIIKIYMGNKSLTQAQLARDVGCLPGSLSDILNGKEIPSVALAMKIAIEICDTDDEREVVAFHLLGLDITLQKIERDFPNAFKSYRASGDGQDGEDSEIHE